MRLLPRFLAGAFAAAALVAAPATAAHADVGHNSVHSYGPKIGSHAVFAQTNDPAGNAVLVFDRASDGTLSPAGSYATGGKGDAQSGAVVDPLASQGSVVYDPASHVLLVTNAGSNSVSVFRVDGDMLDLRQVVPSGGAFPTSIAVHRDLVYVLDAGNAGAVQGYRIDGARLHTINGSTRGLGLANTNPPAFLASPAQVGFSPDGAHLIVTTKSNGSIDVFRVSRDGRLSAAPTANAPAGTVPFAFSFDRFGHLVVVEAGTNSVSTYAIGVHNTLRVLSGPVTDNQMAACWIVAAPNGNFYVANAGSSTLSRFHVAPGGTVTLSPGTTATAGGPIDLAVSSDSRFLYSENGGAGTIDEFRVGANGSLSRIGQITGLTAGVIEGLAAA